MRSGRRACLAGAVLLGALAAVACGSSDDPTTSHIFVSAPWGGDERATYDLLDEGDRIDGTCILETSAGDDVLTLRRLCEDATGEGHRDDGSVEVEPESLIPLHSERVLVNSESGKRTTFTGAYADGVATLGYERVDIASERVEEERSTDRDLPVPDEGSPDPGYYDDESLFWLLRGVPLEEGWEGAYHNVNLGVGRIFVAEVRVDRRERVVVPAGEFDAWRIRVRTASVSQLVWIEAEAPHRMLKAQIERSTYVLRSFE